MKDLYIKFKEWDTQSLNTAVLKAESLWYKKRNVDNALEFDAISLKVEDLIKTATTYQPHDIAYKMKGIVPEFKSLNSEFSVLDNK